MVDGIFNTSYNPVVIMTFIIDSEERRLYWLIIVFTSQILRR